MNVDIHHGPGAAAARVQLGSMETLTSEGGAMIAMSGDMRIETTTHKKGKGSLLKSMKRMLGGESLFLNHFTAGANGGELWLGTVLSGDMFVYDLADESLVVQAGSFVAAEHGVEIDVGWQGFKSLLGGENLVWLNLKVRGKVIFNSFGCIYPIEVQGQTIVDSGHIVAFQETLSFDISKAGKSWMSSFLGGEGLVCKFNGRGTVWCQSHYATGFGRALGPKLRPR